MSRKRSMFKLRSGSSVFRDRNQVGYIKVLDLIKDGNYPSIKPENPDWVFEKETLVYGKFELQGVR